MTGATALVTGGGGFVGSYCVERLVARGYRVVVFDDFSAGRRENLPHAGRGGRLAVKEGSVTDARALADAVAGENVTHVLHLAALHFVPFCRSHPEATWDVNVEGTRNVLRALEQAPIEAFVLASTAAVYEPAALPHAETAALGPIDVYGESKLAAERLVSTAASARPDARFHVARLFNVYGPRETNPHVVPEIIAQLKTAGRLVLGNVWPKRDYVFVDDVAEALVRLLECRSASLLVNVGTGHGTSVQDIVGVLGAWLGRTIPVAEEADRIRTEERASLVADCSRARAILGWRPRHDLRAGLGVLLRHEGLLPGAVLETSR